MAGKPCSICTSPKRLAIEAAIAQGEPAVRIAKRHRLDRNAPLRHQRNHMAAVVVTEQVARRLDLDFRSGEALLEEVGRLRSEAQRLGLQAEHVGDLRAALAAVREQTRIVELLADLARAAAEKRPPPDGDVDVSGLTAEELEVLAKLEVLNAG